MSLADLEAAAAEARAVRREFDSVLVRMRESGRYVSEEFCQLAEEAMERARLADRAVARARELAAREVRRVDDLAGLAEREQA